MANCYRHLPLVHLLLGIGTCILGKLMTKIAVGYAGDGGTHSDIFVSAYGDALIDVTVPTCGCVISS